MKLTREQLREDYKRDHDQADLFTVFHVKWLEERLMSTIESLHKELAGLRKEMGVLIEDPDSPEAAVIRTQWYFAQEIQKQFDTGKPIDVPKLMGLVGKMLNPKP